MLHDLSRNLRHYWRSALAIAAGAAIATAVLAGALLVGDSVRESLRRLTLERLGGIDYALAGQRFFSEETARAFAAAQAEPSRAAPAILLRGSAENAASHVRETGVGIEGVDSAFFSVFADGAAAPDPFAAAPADEPKSYFPPVVINRSLAEALDVQPGDQILLSLQRATEVPAGSLLARDDTQAVVGLVRAMVRAVIADEGLGSFRLDPNQGTPRNAFLPLAALQKALEVEGKVNALVISDPASRELDAAGQRQAATELERRLAGRLQLGDYAIEVVEGEASLAVQSRELLVRPALDAATRRAAQKTGATASPILTWLVNEIGLGERRVPYSTVTALELPQPPAFGSFEGLAPGSAPQPPGEGIWLNEWLAAELEAKPGDRVTLTYYEVGPREELRERSREIAVAGVVALRGAALDKLFTQEYPGISGSTHMADWDPPFPIELSRIRKADEDYWDRFRATPKAFLPLAVGQDWWTTRWGNLSAVRIAPPAGEKAGSFGPRFSEALREELEPAGFGLALLPVKSLGLRAAGGATDFGGLFFGLSFFVIVAAALLVFLLMNLWIEQRAGEIGLRLAVGFPRRAVRRALLAEGIALATLGSLGGLVGALGYAWLMMLGLRTFWRPAVGTSRLELTATPTALMAGFSIALIITVATIYFSVRGVGRTAVPQLLRRSVASSSGGSTGRRASFFAWLGLGGGVLLLAFGILAPDRAGPFAFFAAGVSLLAGLLAGFALAMQRVRPAIAPGLLATGRLALANTRRQYKRSLLATTLIALCTFLIVLVAAFEVDFESGDTGKSSGAGGFALVAEAQVPLQHDLGSPRGRAELGLDETAFAGSAIYPARLLPGEDTSCLNLYQPTRPRLIGLPPDLLARGGFTFKQTTAKTSEKADGGEANGNWALLERDLGPAVIPVVGDFNSTQWILKLPLGGRLPFENERGEKIELELVASLETSIFQSELLISEAQMLRHFPSRGGFSYFLIEAPAERAPELVQALESGLQRYGLDAERTGARLAAFHAVQNTYLSTFRSLGGLGLLLGTLGLAVVLVRNVIERRGELAAMRAFGFERRTLRRLIVGESLVLLLAGLTIGTLAALAGAGSQLLAHPAAAPWLTILATLAAIAATGALAAWLAARGALASPLLPVLKAES